MTNKATRHHLRGGLIALTWLLLTPAAATELINDGFTSGGSAVFQGGFVTGEIGASRFEPAGPCPCFVSQVTLLYGGAAATRTVTLRIWDDSGGSTDPGASLFNGQFQLTASNTDLQLIDLSASGIFVNGPFRVGIEFQDDGLPSIARDDDGSIQPNMNFIFAAGLGWVESSLLGLTGDWIIRATVEEQGSLPGELKNDSWPPTLGASFQGGFVSGESAAVRLSPPGPCPCPLVGASVLIGGGSGDVPVGIRIWDDSGLNDDPGALLYSDELVLSAADAALNLVDLTQSLVTVDGPFRLGFVSADGGFPFVAADDDGMSGGVNFIDEASLGWIDSGTLGVTGDWIMRAAVSNSDLETAVLGHDNWDEFVLPTFQAGFLAGEMAAARLEPAFACPCLVTGARFLFGGDPGPAMVTLRIWEDSGGLAPGTEVYSTTRMLDGQDLALQSIDLAGETILVNGPFRVGIEFAAAGLPSVASDHDGILPGDNFIFAPGGAGWSDATTLGVTGDWIIRATVEQELVFAADFEEP